MTEFINDVKLCGYVTKAPVVVGRNKDSTTFKFTLNVCRTNDPFASKDGMFDYIPVILTKKNDDFDILHNYQGIIMAIKGRLTTTCDNYGQQSLCVKSSSLTTKKPVAVNPFEVSSDPDGDNSANTDSKN